MKRWFMCPRCGVKLTVIQEEPELTIHMCPIEKDWYMTFSGKLLKKLEILSKYKEMSIQDMICRALEEYIKKKAD